jgi:hypothetical protein
MAFSMCHFLESSASVKISFSIYNAVSPRLCPINGFTCLVKAYRDVLYRSLINSINWLAVGRSSGFFLKHLI